MLKEREATSPPCGAGGGAGGGDPPAGGTAVVDGGGGGGGSGAALCSGCGGRISDRYYLLAVDRQWHSACLRCSECRVTLASEQTCFSRGGHIFCKEDYYRMFAVKRCARCQAAISSSELVMRARELVFHLHCFTCATCGTALARGDQFGVSPCGPSNGNGGPPRSPSWQAYCRPHFEQLLTAACCEGHPTLGGGGGDSPGGSPYYHHPGDAVHAVTLPGGGGSPSLSLSGVGIVSAVQKGRPRKRKLTTAVAPVSPLPLGHPADLSHHQHLAMRLSAQALEMVGKGELSSSVDSLGYESGVLSQELSSGMEGMSYDCGVGSPGSLSVQGQQRTKRMRTSFKHHQLRTMKSYFAINQNPDAKDLKQLAQKTGLSKRVLQVWFQNARAKWRRNMMRQENGQSGAGLGGPHAGGGGSTGAGPGGSGGPNPSGPGGGSGGGGLGLTDASLEELHHHHAHHLVHPGGPLTSPPLTLADLY